MRYIPFGAGATRGFRYVFAFLNDSSRSCGLAGSYTATGYSSSVRLFTTTGPILANDAEVIELAPGRSWFVEIVADTASPRDPDPLVCERYDSVVISAPGQGTGTRVSTDSPGEPGFFPTYCEYDVRLVAVDDGGDLVDFS